VRKNYVRSTAGVPLADAGQVVLACEQSARMLAGVNRKQPLYFSEPLPKEQWILRAFDSQYFQVWQKGLRNRHRSSSDFWNLATSSWQFYSEEPLIVRVELNLTWLELQLRKGDG
jgi:hypothetical protein